MKRALFYRCDYGHIHTESTAVYCQGWKAVLYLLDLSLVSIQETKKQDDDGLHRSQSWYCFSCQVVTQNHQSRDAEFALCSKCDNLMEKLIFGSLYVKPPISTSYVADDDVLNDIKDFISKPKKGQTPPQLVNKEFTETILPEAASFPFWCQRCGHLNVKRKERDFIVKDFSHGRLRMICEECETERKGTWECKDCQHSNLLSSALDNPRLLAYTCTSCLVTTRAIAINFTHSAILDTIDPIEQSYVTLLSKALRKRKIDEARRLPAFIEEYMLFDAVLRKKQTSFGTFPLRSLSETCHFFTTLLENNIRLDEVCLWQHLSPKITDMLTLWEKASKLNLPLAFAFWHHLAEHIQTHPEAAFFTFFSLQTENILFSYPISQLLVQYMIYGYDKGTQHSLLTLLQACRCI